MGYLLKSCCAIRIVSSGFSNCLWPVDFSAALLQRGSKEQAAGPECLRCEVALELLVLEINVKDFLSL